MKFKIIFAFTFVAVASAGYAPVPSQSAPIAVHANPIAVAKHPSTKYKFGYGVDIWLTGDTKSQFEERDGDVVHGEYTVNDPDGFKRIVKYTADAHKGFNAFVHREPVVKSVYVPPNYAPIDHYSLPDLHYLPVM